MIDEAEQERQSMKGVELIGLSCGADGLRPITPNSIHSHWAAQLQQIPIKDFHLSSLFAFHWNEWVGLELCEIIL